MVLVRNSLSHDTTVLVWQRNSEPIFLKDTQTVWSHPGIVVAGAEQPSGWRHVRCSAIEQMPPRPTLGVPVCPTIPPEKNNNIMYYLTVEPLEQILTNHLPDIYVIQNKNIYIRISHYVYNDDLSYLWMSKENTRFLKIWEPSSPNKKNSWPINMPKTKPENSNVTPPSNNGNSGCAYLVHKMCQLEAVVPVAQTVGQLGLGGLPWPPCPWHSTPWSWES